MPKTIDLGKLYDPSTNSKQMLAHRARETYLLFGGAFGGGKTAMLVNEGIRLSVKYPGNVGYLCRFRETDFKSSTMMQVEKFIPSELIRVHHKTEKYWQLINGSIIFYGGLQGDEETKTKINSMELGWFGIDQAEEVTEKQFLLLCGRLRLMINGKAPKYKGILTCNPDPGWLRDRFIENTLPDHKFVPALPKDNEKYLPDDYVDRLRELYPEAMCQRLLEGNWDIDVAGNYLIPYSSIREAINRDSESSGDKIAGVDVSRYGGDETVFLLRQGDKVLHIESWAHQDTTYSAGRVARLIREHKPVVTCIDVVGVGAGVVDPLKAEGFAIREVNVGEGALDKELYYNKRAEYFSLLAKRFQKGEIDIPDHSKLASQLAGVKYTYRQTKLQIESKESLFRRGEKSPDFADALMLAFCFGDEARLMGKPINTLTFGGKDERSALIERWIHAN